MKDTDKVTLTIGQLKKLINESNTVWKPKFKVGDYVVNKRDPNDIFYIRNVYIEDDIYDCCYDAQFVNPKTMKRQGISIDIWAVQPDDDYASEDQFKLLKR